MGCSRRVGHKSCLGNFAMIHQLSNVLDPILQGSIQMGTRVSVSRPIYGYKADIVRIQQIGKGRWDILPSHAGTAKENHRFTVFYAMLTISKFAAAGKNYRIVDNRIFPGRGERHSLCFERNAFACGFLCWLFCRLVLLSARKYML